jgi:hypothetical protein
MNNEIKFLKHRPLDTPFFAGAGFSASEELRSAQRFESGDRPHFHTSFSFIASKQGQHSEARCPRGKVGPQGRTLSPRENVHPFVHPQG